MVCLFCLELRVCSCLGCSGCSSGSSSRPEEESKSSRKQDCHPAIRSGPALGPLLPVRVRSSQARTKQLLNRSKKTTRCFLVQRRNIFRLRYSAYASSFFSLASLFGRALFRRGLRSGFRFCFCSLTQEFGALLNGFAGIFVACPVILLA